MNRIGITGSKGFIGSHIIDFLKNKKNVKLFFFDLPENNLLKPDEDLKKFVRNNNIIIHTAAVNRGSDAEIVAGSVVATYNLISAMVNFKSQSKLIFLSSIQAETETLYGQSKRLTEIILEDFSNNYKVPVSIFRLTNVFGEGCRPFYNSAVATFCYQVVNNKELTVHPESKNRKMDLIYVGDIAKIVVREAFIKRKKPFYFRRVVSRNEITVGELAKLIQSFKIKPIKRLKTKFYQDLYLTYRSYI